jgi:RNA polymerase sigma-70 factor, ECF subfamily
VPILDRLRETIVPRADVGAKEIPLDGIRELWGAADAGSVSISEVEFGLALAAAGAKYNFGLPGGVIASIDQRMEFYRSLHLNELALACGCALGREPAWEHFFQRYRAALTQAAIGIAGSSSLGEDLAGSLYGELFGLKEHGGERRSPLASYTGRGSLMGWLRAMLVQRNVDRHRRTYREAPLEDDGFEAPPVTAPPDPSELQQLNDALDRFLLATYFLEGRTQLELARLLRVHEATVSRRLKALTKSVRTRLLKDLQARGIGRRAAEEMLGTDPRDLSINLRNLLQPSQAPAFLQQVGKT